MKRHCLEEKDAGEGIEMEITAYGIHISPVTSFKYIGRFLLAADVSWPAVVRNLIVYRIVMKNKSSE